MKKETSIALTVVTGAILIMIVGAVILWKGNEPEQAPIVKEPAVEQRETEPEALSYQASDSEPVEEGVTRIIIENPEQYGKELQDILSEKIIINDEVKDIKEVQ